jgi:DNA-3-methyladenine glycosylase II
MENRAWVAGKTPRRAGKRVLSWRQNLCNPTRVLCHNIALSANKGSVERPSLLPVVTEDLGAHHAGRRRYAMEFSIRPEGPFDLDLTLQRYRLFGDDAAHAYVDGVYHRVIEIDGRLWVYALSLGGSTTEPVIRVQIRGGRAQDRHRCAVEAEVRRSLSLDTALEPFYRWAGADPILAQLIALCYGMRPPRTPTLFEALVTSISAQQVNLAFATTTRSRLVKRFGPAVTIDGRLFYGFPAPASLAEASLQELREMQFSWRKAEYIVNLARLVTGGELRLEEFPHLSNEEIIERITEVKGLGRWTADWLLARGLGRGDVVAAGDLGVRKAVGRFYFYGQTPSIEEVRMFAARWGVFQSLAVHYLLAGLRLPDVPPIASAPTPPRRPRKAG